MPTSATIVNDCENGDCVQQPSSSTSGVLMNATTREVIGAPRNAMTREALRQQGKTKRSCGSTSLAKGDGQPCSSEAGINPPRSRRTTPRRSGEDDMTTADKAISDSQIVRGTSDVPLPPTGRHQESRNTNKRSSSSSARAVGEPGSNNTTIAHASGRHKINRKRSRGTSRSSTTDERPGSSSERADEESDIEAGSTDARVTEDDLTPAEKNIPGTLLLGNLGGHPSVFARAGLVRHISIYYYSSGPSLFLVDYKV